MSVFKLLVVEDNEDELATCKRTVRVYEAEKGVEIEVVECKTVRDASNELDGTFDGAIIDLRLEKDGEGNEVVRMIEEAFLRVPVAILTGTPDSVDTRYRNIGVFKKGDRGAGYADLMNRFWRIYDTGLTRILGGRGVIEESLGSVFHNNLLPQIKQWQKYAHDNPTRTEKALLRYTLNHLIQIIDEDADVYFPEEFYLRPPLTDQIHTGSILIESSSTRKFTVISPECDLVPRIGERRNTDRILLAQILSAKTLFPGLAKVSGPSRREKSQLDNACKNRIGHLHRMPETAFVELSFLNFRELSTVDDEELESRFELPPAMQISPTFVKDIVGRFSSFYARQGQPELDFGTS